MFSVIILLGSSPVPIVLKQGQQKIDASIGYRTVVGVMSTFGSDSKDYLQPAVIGSGYSRCQQPI